MPNLSQLAPLTTKVAALGGLVLVSPQSTIGYLPQALDDDTGADDTADLTPPPSFVFNYEGQNVLQLESDITDHFSEDNLPLEDQIALKPVIYTVQGFIGELTDIAPAFLAPIQFAADKLTTIGAYAPQLSTTALLAYTEAFFLYQTAAAVGNTAVSAWARITDSGESVIGSDGIEISSNQTKQQVALQQLYGYWNERRLFTIQTPWAILEDMAILKVRAVQESETTEVSEFAVDFKMIRTASTETAGGLISNIPQGRLKSQSSGLTDQGTSSPLSSIGLGNGLSQMGVV